MCKSLDGMCKSLDGFAYLAHPGMITRLFLYSRLKNKSIVVTYSENNQYLTKMQLLTKVSLKSNIKLNIHMYFMQGINPIKWANEL